MAELAVKLQDLSVEPGSASVADSAIEAERRNRTEIKDSAAVNDKTADSSRIDTVGQSNDAEKAKNAGKLKKKSEDGGEEDHHDEDDTGKFYDEVEIEDMEFDEKKQAYFYPCPCGDRFVITKEDLSNGEEIARCPSCSLIIKVIYDPEDFARESDNDSDNENDENEGDADGDDD